MILSEIVEHDDGSATVKFQLTKQEVSDIL